MRRIKLSILGLVVSSISLLFLFSSCDKNNTPVKVASISLDKNEISLKINETLTLNAKVLPVEAKNEIFTWSSSNPLIASVHKTSGLVTAVSVGTATISVTTSDGSHTANCNVTVTSPFVAVTSITIQPKTIEIEEGATSQLTSTINPENATNKEYKYSSDNISVATVDETSGLVTAIHEGSATITVTITGGGYTDICNVVVTAKEKLTVAEIKYFSDLATVYSHIDEYWKGYSSFMATKQIFIVTSENQGVLINPVDDFKSTSRLISHSIKGFENVRLYRNDEVLALAKKEFETRNVFSFAVFGGQSTYLYKLNDFSKSEFFYFLYKNRNGYYDVSIFFHELFHEFQLADNNVFFFSTQDFDDYPVTEQTLPYQLLLFKVMRDAYLQKDMVSQTKYLKYYLSLNNKLESIDPTDKKLIRNHGFFQEKAEGIPRYIEVFATLNVLNNNTIEDPTHGYENYLNTATKKLEVRNVFEWRIFYHVGAGVMYLLKGLEYPNIEQAILSKNTFYDIGKSFLNLTEEDMVAILDEVKVQYDWTAIQTEAAHFLSLP